MSKTTTNRHHRAAPGKSSSNAGASRPNDRRRPKKVRSHPAKESKLPIFVSLAPLYRKNAIQACRLAIQTNDPGESVKFAEIAERWVTLAEAEEARAA